MSTEILVNLLRGVIPKAFQWILQRVKAKKPIEWSVEHFVEDQWSVIFPGKRDTLAGIEGKRMRGSEIHARLLKLGAVDYVETRVRLQLRARTSAPVLIKQITAHAVKSAPINGIKITHPTAGVSDSTLLLVDFDDDGVVLPLWSAVEESFDIRREGTRPFFSRRQINLSQTAYETLIIVAKTSRYLVSWTLNIEYEVAGIQGSVQIDNVGMSFRTTGEPLEGCSADLLWAWHDGHKLLPMSDFDLE